MSPAELGYSATSMLTLYSLRVGIMLGIQSSERRHSRSKRKAESG